MAIRRALGKQSTSKGTGGIKVAGGIKGMDSVPRKSINGAKSEVLAKRAFGDVEDGFLNRVGAASKWGWNNAVASGGGKKRGLAKGIGGHALRGAVTGGVAGGTLEAMQGGSFWEGAKSGALSGATIWGGWNMGARMAGSNKKVWGKDSVGSNAATMWNATGKNDVSKQALAILNQKQRDGLARIAMNKNKK